MPLPKPATHWYIPLAPQAYVSVTSQEASELESIDAIALAETFSLSGFLQVWRGVEQPGSSSGS
jgi:hypothetical protein